MVNVNVNPMLNILCQQQCTSNPCSLVNEDICAGTNDPSKDHLYYTTLLPC